VKICVCDGTRGMVLVSEERNTYDINQSSHKEFFFSGVLLSSTTFFLGPYTGEV